MTNVRHILFALIGSLLLLCSYPASAAILEVYPAQSGTPGLADTPGSVQGNSVESAPGFGDGSWAATGVKSNYYATPDQLFGHSVQVSDVLSMSYWTNQIGFLGSNWSLYIYTMPTGVGDSKSWYRSRLFAVPGDGPAGWTDWTTDT